MYNLHPTNKEMQHQSMHHVSQSHVAGNDHYSLTEKSAGHLVIRIPEKGMVSAEKAIKSVTKLAIPDTLQAESNNSYTLIWISPDEFLLLVPEFKEADVEEKLRNKMEGHFAIANLTGGQTLLELSGERAETILKKSAVYDVHESNFPVAKAVTTKFAKSQLILIRTGADSFQLIVRRSFSDYIWEWIVDAGLRA